MSASFYTSVDIKLTADNLGVVSDALRLVVANFERRAQFGARSLDPTPFIRNSCVQ